MITDFQAWFFPNQTVRLILVALFVVVFISVQFFGEMYLFAVDLFRKPPKE